MKNTYTATTPQNQDFDFWTQTQEDCSQSTHSEASGNYGDPEDFEADWEEELEPERDFFDYETGRDWLDFHKIKFLEAFREIQWIDEEGTLNLKKLCTAQAIVNLITYGVSIREGVLIRIENEDYGESEGLEEEEDTEKKVFHKINPVALARLVEKSRAGGVSAALVLRGAKKPGTDQHDSGACGYLRREWLEKGCDVLVDPSSVRDIREKLSQMGLYELAYPVLGEKGKTRRPPTLTSFDFELALVFSEFVEELIISHYDLLPTSQQEEKISGFSRLPTHKGSTMMRLYNAAFPWKYRRTEGGAVMEEQETCYQHQPCQPQPVATPPASQQSQPHVQVHVQVNEKGEKIYTSYWEKPEGAFGIDTYELPRKSRKQKQNTIVPEIVKAGTWIDYYNKYFSDFQRKPLAEFNLDALQGYSARLRQDLNDLKNNLVELGEEKWTGCLDMFERFRGIIDSQLEKLHEIEKANLAKPAWEGEW